MEKILQIIPAPPNMWAKWEPESEGDEVGYSRIVCLALIEDEVYGKPFQTVVPMSIFEDGDIQNVFELSNFGGIVFKKEMDG